jgi:beta-galactosidase GanA
MADYSPFAQAQFRLWLKQKYSAIAALNVAWGTHYPDFGVVPAPDRIKSREYSNILIKMEILVRA